MRATFTGWGAHRVGVGLGGGASGGSGGIAGVGALGRFVGYVGLELRRRTKSRGCVLGVDKMAPGREPGPAG